MIKEAILDLEKKIICKLLQENGIEFDKLIDKTFYLEENDLVIGTVSCYKNIIKCIALKSGYTGMGYFEKLVSEMINYLYQNGITHIMVYTKPVYEMQFKSMGFSVIAKTDNVITLEYGTTNNDFGKIVIEMEDETKGVVKETEGEIGNIFDIDSNITYVS